MDRERIAAELHAIWSDWMKDLFAQCGFETKTIPDELWHDWAWRMHLLLGPPPDPLGEFRLDQPFERLEAEIGKDDPLADAARLEQERRKAERARRAAEEGLPPPDEDADTLAESEGFYGHAQSVRIRKKS